MSQRICYIVPTLRIYGGVLVVFEHANRLQGRGFEVTILSTGSENTQDWFPDNRVSLLSIDQEYPRCFDVVVVTSWDTAYKARLLGLQAQRWIYLVQDNESRFFPAGDLEADLARLTYFAPYEHIVVAKWMKDWLEREFHQSALVAPNGINEMLIHPMVPLAPRTNRLRVLLEGNLNDPRKGMDDAFTAVKDLDVDVWCVSTGGKLKDWHRCDRLFSAVPYGKMAEIYSSCDVLLKMSKVDSFSYPPLEIMACGGTAVMSRFAGHNEYAIDGENCLKVDIGDTIAAANKIRLLDRNRSMLQYLKTNGLSTASQRNWDSTIGLLQAYFKTPVTRSFAFNSSYEEAAFLTLAKFTDKLFLDIRRMKPGSSMQCLRQIHDLEHELASLKALKSYRIARSMWRIRSLVKRYFRT